AQQGATDYLGCWPSPPCGPCLNCTASTLHPAGQGGPNPMRRTLTCLSLLLFGGLVLAASRFTGGRARSDLPMAEAQSYAQQLNYFIAGQNGIVNSYVPPTDRDARPPTAKDLAAAALEGLYDA